MFNSIREIAIAREHYKDLRREADAYRRLHTDAPKQSRAVDRVLADLGARLTGTVANA